MTLPENEPTDQRLVSELPSYIRENRAALNDIEGLENTVGATDINVAPGTISLVVGTDLGDYGYESITMAAVNAAILESITNGTHGQVKVIVFGDDDIDLVDSNSQINGTFYLNQLPAGEEFDLRTSDVIALMNIGGSPGIDDGYWKELYRTISVK